MQFEWNSEKARSNARKHHVSFSEATTVFNDPLSLTFPDSDHSFDEYRYITIGFSAANRLLIIAHTDREERVRIISAREATKQEKRFYEDAE